MFERFTARAIETIVLAQKEAHRLGHNFVGTEQILLGLIAEEAGIAARILRSFGIGLGGARIEVEKIIGRGNFSGKRDQIPFTPRTKRVLGSAWDEADQLGDKYIDTEHLLLGLIREREGVAFRVLQNFGVDLSQMQTQVLQTIQKPPQAEVKVQVAAKPKAETKVDRFRKRRKLFQLLSTLPAAQFNEVVFGLEVPTANIPSSSAPQADRVMALVAWAESPVGCGLGHLEEVLQLIVDVPN